MSQEGGGGRKRWVVRSEVGIPLVENKNATFPFHVS